MLFDMVPSWMGHSIWKNWETGVLVCLVFSVFSKELLTSNSENTESESLDPSIDFFAWFHIVCHRYASKKVHFTFSNTIWPLSLSSISRTHMNGWSETLSYWIENYSKNLRKILPDNLFIYISNVPYCVVYETSEGKANGLFWLLK